MKTILLIILIVVVTLSLRYLLKIFVAIKNKNIRINELSEANIIESVNENYYILKNNCYTKVVEIAGFNYNFLNTEDDYIAKIKQISNVFDIDENVDVKVVLRKSIKETHQEETHTSANIMICEMQNKINNAFNQVFEVKYFIYVTHNDLTILNKIAEQILARFGNVSSNEITSENKKHHDSFNAKILNKNELFEELIYLINNTKIDLLSKRLNNKKDLAIHDINYSDLLCDTKNGLGIIRNQIKTKYFQVYSIIFKEDEADSFLFDDLLKEQFELEIMFNSQIMDYDTSLKTFTRDTKLNKIKESMGRKFNQNSERIISAIEHEEKLLKDSKTRIINTDILIFLYAENEEELVEQDKLLTRFFESRIIKIHQEHNLVAWSYLSRFIGFTAFNLLEKPSGKERLKDLVYNLKLAPDILGAFLKFREYPIGNIACDWGKSAVAKFKTNYNMLYNFTFHISEDKEAVAHTVAIAPTGAGKTTLYQYLIFNAIEKYKNLHVYIFDRLSGMEVFTSLVCGYNLDFNDDNIELNPLQIDLNNNQNVLFLEKFFLMLTNISVDDVEEVRNINLFIQYLKNIPIAERQLSFLLDYGFPKNSKIYNHLKGLLSSNNARFLDGKKDSLDILENKLVTFQMDNILDDEKLSAPIIYYIMFRIRQQVKELALPHLIFIDETAKMIKNPHFLAEMEVLMYEHRKLRGSINVAFQDTTSFLGNEKLSSLIRRQCQSVLTFYTPNLKYDDYKDLEINEIFFQEFKDTVEKSNNIYQVLLKRGSEHVILDINLKNILGEHLKFFASGSEAVRHMKELNVKYGKDWQNYYLEQGV